jgi:hypothetical protein
MNSILVSFPAECLSDDAAPELEVRAYVTSEGSHTYVDGWIEVVAADGSVRKLEEVFPGTTADATDRLIDEAARVWSRGPSRDDDLAAAADYEHDRRREIGEEIGDELRGEAFELWANGPGWDD